MTKKELYVIQKCAERIEYLASLEHAMFSGNSEKDESIKDAIRPYMQWFGVVAMHLQDLVEISESEKDRYYKKYKMDDLVEQCERM